MSVLILLLGFTFLILGADRFVVGSSSLAKKLGIPSLIIGLTVVAFGTSAPELAVSVAAGINGANEIALGNILGSNIFNLLVVAGLSATISPLVVEKDLLNRDWLASIIATFVVAILMLIGTDVSQLDGAILLIAFIFVLFLQIKSAKKDKTNITSEEDEIKPQRNLFIVLNIVFGLAAIIIGGQMAVKGATEIAISMHMSETLIGLTIVAIGTSLPELVTSIVATKRGENAIAIGNVIGSNLFNILFILSASSMLNPIKVLSTAIFDTIILLAVSIFMLILAKKQKLNRFWGVILFALYVIYTIYIVVR